VTPLRDDSCNSGCRRQTDLASDVESVPVATRRRRRHRHRSRSVALISDQERAHELESPTLLHTTPWDRRRRLGLLGRAYNIKAEPVCRRSLRFGPAGFHTRFTGLRSPLREAKIIIIIILQKRTPAAELRKS